MITTDHIDEGDINAFAAVIKSRVAAEARVARAMGFAWLGAGAAIASGLTGLRIAAAVSGYSYMISGTPAAEQTAKALVMALEHTPLQTTVSGTMTLAPNSEVRLAPNQTVRLQEGSTVKLDSSSSVRVTLVDMPHPSSQQLGLGIKATTNELPFTS